MISIRGVSKRFGQQVVLDNVSLEVDSGCTTTIVGPSGVGKSVLLKITMGIMQPDCGEVLINDYNITAAKNEAERNEIRSILGVLFQSAALFDSLTIEENVAFGLRERTHLRRREVLERTYEMLEALGLENHAKSYPQQVSIGMRKRVGMARSLIMQPKVLLFDEPNTGLDPLTGQEVYDLIRDCREKWGFTGLVVSHELPEVFQISDRIAMLLHGRIILEGTPEDFRNSTDPAVQQFLYGRTDGPIKIQ